MEREKEGERKRGGGGKAINGQTEIATTTIKPTLPQKVPQVLTQHSEPAQWVHRCSPSLH